MFGQIGSIIGTGLDALLNRPGKDAGAVPDLPILSSQVVISLIGPDGEDLQIGTFDEIQKQKLISEKKRFKPFGCSRHISIKEDKGWEINFSGQKTDGAIDRLIYIQEKYLSGIGQSTIPNSESTFNASTIIGSNLLFSVREYTSVNGNYLTYLYKDCSIVSYSETTPSDNNPVTYTLGMFSPYRDIVDNGTGDPDAELETVLTNIILDIVSRNKQ